ncbi:MAG: 30S ribosome-binding factor RbfA [Planctomycetota bacterium]
MSTHRLGRVAKELQRELSQIILYELRQPNLGFITITRVEPTSDLQYAKVFITVLDDGNKRKTTLELLNKASGYIHRVLEKRIRMRYIPRLSFHFDDTVEKEQRIFRLFSEIDKMNGTVKNDNKIINTGNAEMIAETQNHSKGKK